MEPKLGFNIIITILFTILAVKDVNRYTNNVLTALAILAMGSFIGLSFVGIFIKLFLL